MIKVDKAWGGEVWLANTDKYCGKLLHINEGWQSSLHYHQIKDETFYLLSGQVQLELNDKILMLAPGDSVHIPPFVQHRFSGLKKSIIIEVSTHHSDDDVVRLQLSRRIEQ